MTQPEKTYKNSPYFLYMYKESITYKKKITFIELSLTPYALSNRSSRTPVRCCDKKG